MTYDQFRHFADSWGLLFMALTYLTLVAWALLPRNRARNRRAATMIFDTETGGDRDHG
jgi:cytochrome c oxidase cbb3-type subunit 4